MFGYLENLRTYGRGIIFAVVAMSCLLTACGGGGGGSDTADNNTDTTSEPSNSRPVSDSGVNQQIILGFDNVVLDGSNSQDPDGDDLRYFWELLQAPVGSTASIANEQNSIADFTPDITGTYRIQLTVDDGELIDTSTIDIDVANNRLPTPVAGPVQTVNRGEVVTLDGSGSNDPDGHSLTYTWTQLANSCPDVTEGTGSLAGVQPAFTSPDVICTLAFDLRVSDGAVNSFSSRIYILVHEDKDNAVYVDGTNGDDANPGTRSEPMRTIQAAISKARIDGVGADVYVTAGTYNVSRLYLADGVSVYGAYDNNWERDYAYVTDLIGNSTAVSGIGLNNVTLDGLHISSADGANSIALMLSRSDDIRITNNTIISGDGRDGVNGDDGSDGAVPGSNGQVAQNSSCQLGGAGGAGGSGGGYSGGAGGGGGYGSSAGNPGQDGYGPYGGRTSGADGSNGRAGQNGQDARSLGTFYRGGYVSSIATSGANGMPGNGGAGGRGSDGAIVGSIFPQYYVGNGGGGGGSGGSAGTGGTAGATGASSFALYMYDVTNLELSNNVISAGRAGDGGDPGLGGVGAPGGQGGIGGSGCLTYVSVGSAGGDGGTGGSGGDGGAGAGGLSIGIVANFAVDLDANQISFATQSRGGAPDYSMVPGQAFYLANFQ